MEVIEMIKERLSIFKNLYDSIRIVDPINKKIINFQEDNTQIEKDICYGILKKDGYCKNCVSMRAYIENDTFLKIEFAEGKLLLITASAVTIENNIYRLLIFLLY